MSRAKLGPSEAQIAAACNDLLALDSWRRVVTDPPQLRGLGVSEKGIPDGLYLRYEHEGPWPRDFISDLCWCQCLWVEWKRKGGKAAQHQCDWHAAEKARGALVLLAGVDFPATIEGFQGWYEKSGLARKVRLR